MGEIDPGARAIGTLEGELKGIKTSLGRLEKTVSCIDKKLTATRINVATLASAVSISTTLMVLALRHYLFK